MRIRYSTYYLRWHKSIKYYKLRGLIPIPGIYFLYDRFKSFLGCIKWRATRDCKADGNRDPSNDKTCDHQIEDSDQGGYCECENGKKVMKKGCERLEFYGYAYTTCKEACSEKGIA